MGRLPDEIVTRRLHLRLWRPDDVPALRAGIEASLDHLRPWLAWVPFEPVSDEDRTRFIVSSNEDWEQGGDAAYGVFRDGVVVGGCGLHHRWGPNTLDLGYWVHVDHIGQGYAQELARGLTEAAFAVEGIDRVEIHHDKANERSRAVPVALDSFAVRSSPTAWAHQGMSGSTARGRSADRSGPLAFDDRE